MGSGMTASSKTGKVGRPPLPESERATWRTTLRLSEADGARVEAAATAAGVDVGAWIRERVLAALKRVRS